MCLASSLLHRVALPQPSGRQLGVVNDFEPRIGQRRGVRDRTGPVGRMVVDDDRFELDVLLGQDGREPTPARSCSSLRAGIITEILVARPVPIHDRWRFPERPLQGSQELKGGHGRDQPTCQTENQSWIRQWRTVCTNSMVALSRRFRFWTAPIILETAGIQSLGKRIPRWLVRQPIACS